MPRYEARARGVRRDVPRSLLPLRSTLALQIPIFGHTGVTCHKMSPESPVPLFEHEEVNTQCSPAVPILPLASNFSISTKLTAIFTTADTNAPSLLPTISPRQTPVTHVQVLPRGLSSRESGFKFSTNTSKFVFPQGVHASHSATPSATRENTSSALAISRPPPNSGD